MPAPAKQPTPAELSGLEHAFAADPMSDAYRPLTEAYLAMGRFMEAMVVCKKGVKAHPDDPAAKVLLARVYAEQGKDRKALDELQAVLAAYPTFAAANRMAGELYMRLGDKEQGAAALRRAAEAAPDDPEVREAIAKHGITVARKPAAPAAAAPAPSPGGPPVAPRVARSPAAGNAPAAAAPAGAAAQDHSGITGEIRIDEATPAATPAPKRGHAYAEELAAKYGTREFTISSPAGRKARAAKRGTLLTTVGLFAVLVVALGGFWLFNKARAEKVREIDRLLKEALPLIDKDVPAAYADAAGKCRAILERDDTSIAGHAFLAYVDALLAGEHGGGDEAKGEAVRHVDAARKLGQRHSHLVAAEAYLKLYGGDPAGAKETLKAVLEGEQGVQSPFLLGVLGAVQLREGELDQARDTLGKAQKASPGDVRVAWLLAEQYRRRGEGYELQASGFYDYALRIQKDHLSSILGKGLVLLDRGQVEEAGKAAELVLSPQAGASRPQQALAYAIRAGVLGAQGKGAEAKAAEEQAAKLDPTSADIPHRVAVRKLREGDAAGAAEAMQRAVNLDPRRVSLYADLVRALLAKEGGAKQAIDTVKKAVARLGEQPRLALVLGDAYRAAGDADLARGQYEKAIQLGRPFPDARVALARLHRAKNNIPGALVELTQAIDEYGQGGGGGGAAAAYVEMAEAERARGAKADVVKGLYVKALEKDPASCDALWGASKIELDQGSLGEDGRRRLESYVRVCPRASHAAEAARAVGKTG
jgi:tetratricopeptide (TPR) repeat protein